MTNLQIIINIRSMTSIISKPSNLLGYSILLGLRFPFPLWHIDSLRTVLVCSPPLYTSAFTSTTLVRYPPLPLEWLNVRFSPFPLVFSSFCRAVCFCSVCVCLISSSVVFPFPQSVKVMTSHGFPCRGRLFLTH